jgi:4-amino-4-deoxy-L-arabinose transferase-like glycosyltransferase
MKNLLFKYSKYILLLALLYIPIFSHMSTLPIRIWDEARLAINAYEMNKYGDWIVTHAHGSPDLWNTKPPLLIWLQVVCMKVIGVNEIAVRLPSAIAALLTCLAILFLSVKYLKQFWFGFIAIIVLITSQGYTDFHTMRTGDYDTLLTMFTTFIGIFFFFYIESDKNKYLDLFFLSTILAVLTKGVAGLLFMPAIIIYCVWQKHFLVILKNKHFYIGIIFFIIIAIGYYLLRETKNPGYIAAIFNGELGGRFLNSYDGEVHRHGFWYYYDGFISTKLTSWYLLIPCGSLLGLFNRNVKIFRITFFSTIMVLTYFVVISLSQTKTEWYDMPIYPYFSLLIAVFIYSVFDFIRNSEWLNNNFKPNITPFIFLFIILITPYREIIGKTYIPKELYSWDNDFYEMGYFLKNAVNGKENVDNYFLLYDGYGAQNEFYVNILNDKGINISFKDWKTLKEGDKVIVQQQSIKDFIEQNYSYNIIGRYGNNVIKYEIINNHKK